MKRDFCQKAVVACVRLLIAKNHPEATDSNAVWDYPSRTLAQSWLVDAVMRTRGADADRRKVTRMVNALWECEG